MGIFVPNATLPSGLQVNNVYMSFTNEAVFVFPRDNMYLVRSSYKVYNDQSKLNGTETVCQLLVPTDNINQNVYTILYNALKEQFPNSVDV
jgi:hypothetical protein